MPSKARKAFDANVKDVKRLLEIHTELGGSKRGRKYDLEVLNKSAIVLITAFWEAYCEDISTEALDHIVDHVSRASKLPTELKKRLATEIKKDKNEIAMWGLADRGWKSKVKARLAALTEDRNRKLNTPKSDKIDQLFEDAIGLAKVSEEWKWKRMTPVNARKKLDKYVTLRGAIAHRGRDNVSCKKVQVSDYFDHIKHLVSRTGGKVNSFVHQITHKALW